MIRAAANAALWVVGGLLFLLLWAATLGKPD